MDNEVHRESKSDKTYKKMFYKRFIFVRWLMKSKGFKYTALMN